MKEKLSPENVIAATVAGLRHSKSDAYEIAKTIIRDLGYFGYHIQRDEEATSAAPSEGN